MRKTWGGCKNPQGNWKSVYENYQLKEYHGKNVNPKQPLDCLAVS